MDEDFHNKAGSTRHRKAAMTLYDGPFEIHNSDFFDFSTEASTFRLDNGQLVNNTSIPFVGTWLRLKLESRRKKEGLDGSR